jgi:hypothetical protein
LEKQDIFALCRDIPATAAAGACGIRLSMRGDKYWALCPLHRDTDPSLMFDGEGRWHCFGCGQGGDAVDLYAKVKQVPPLEAAQALLARVKPAAAAQLAFVAEDQEEAAPRAGTAALSKALYAASDGAAQVSARDVARRIAALQPLLGEREGIAFQSVFMRGKKLLRLHRQQAATMPPAPQIDPTHPHPPPPCRRGLAKRACLRPIPYTQLTPTHPHPPPPCRRGLTKQACLRRFPYTQLTPTHPHPLPPCKADAVDVERIAAYMTK